MLHHDEVDGPARTPTQLKLRLRRRTCRPSRRRRDTRGHRASNAEFHPLRASITLEGAHPPAVRDLGRPSSVDPAFGRLPQPFPASAIPSIRAKELPA